LESDCSVPFLVIFNFDPSFSSPQIWMISLGSKCEVSEIPVDQVHFTILQKGTILNGARVEFGASRNLNGQKRSNNIVSMWTDNPPFRLRMQSYGPNNIGFWIMGFGLLIMMIGIALIASWTANIFYLVTGWFVLTLGIACLALGLSGYGRWDRPPVPKVRCRHCYMLNYESAIHCRKCGSNMF